jgi:hypothetical protein
VTVVRVPDTARDRDLRFLGVCALREAGWTPGKTGAIPWQSAKAVRNRSHACSSACVQRQIADDVRHVLNSRTTLAVDFLGAAFLAGGHDST